MAFFRVGAAESAEAALQQFQQASWDVVLLDIKMPGMNGLELQRRLHSTAVDTVIIMLTAHGTIETAVEALKAGAFDYLTKPVDPDELSRVVAKALQHRRLISENVRLRAKLESLSGYDQIVGESPPMKQVLGTIDSLAGSDVTVLIRGESGTGKELVARAIHARGSRRYFPLVAVNCGAFPESLLESELFGHERGAFTGAQQRRKGKLEQADGGTLFLDEIGSVSARMQVQLLRVLDTKELTRVGGSRTIRTDFRVVCATNQDLEEMVAEKLFREDLYFRINVFCIDLPPLRERPGDVLLLAAHFLQRFATKAEKEITEIEPDAMAALVSHEWPGNVRELANVIERGVVVGEPPALRLEDLPLRRLAPNHQPGGDSLAEIEKVHIARVLERLGWNISQAARTLEVDRATLYSKIKRYGLRK
jgi:DNA-binding NtrC family response regulator